MKNENSKKSWLIGGVATGLAAGLIFFATNKNARSKVTNTFEAVSCRTNEWLQFIRDNREPFVNHIRSSAERVATIVEDASEDIQTIVESSQQLKEHTFDILGTIQEAKEEFEELATKLKHPDELGEDLANLEESNRKQFPTSESDNEEPTSTT
ncbi:hypothetical protein [Alteribacter populi]|uniref:hypothetical protein n=1 Tax=Alteribacter populi TaxID=2011011 RepID=UPI000BBB43F0|nr:hypothetical protein [Alteribacter populi]